MNLRGFDRYGLTTLHTNCPWHRQAQQIVKTIINKLTIMNKNRSYKPHVVTVEH